MSSQYDVSVGGLDFADNYLGVASSYWNATNNAFYGSAKSYIMEQPWNDSCASTLLAHYSTGSYVTYGSSGFCNTADRRELPHWRWVAAAAPAAAPRERRASRGVVSGTCAG